MMAIPGCSDYTGKWALQHALPPCCISQLTQLADVHQKNMWQPHDTSTAYREVNPKHRSPSATSPILGRKENHPAFFPWWIVAMDFNSAAHGSTFWTFAWRASTIISCCFWNCQRWSSCLRRSMFTNALRSNWSSAMRDFADGAGERETRYIYRWHLATIVTEVIINIYI